MIIFATVSGPPLSPWIKKSKLLKKKHFAQTLQGPAPAPPAQMIRSSLTASVRFILSKQVLLCTIGTKVSCSLSVEVSVTPVAPQPEQDKSL